MAASSKLTPSQAMLVRQLAEGCRLVLVADGWVLIDARGVEYLGARSDALVCKLQDKGFVAVLEPSDPASDRSGRLSAGLTSRGREAAR